MAAENNELVNENLNTETSKSDNADDGAQNTGAEGEENLNAGLGQNNNSSNAEDDETEKSKGEEGAGRKENKNTDAKGIYGAPEVYDYKDVKLPNELEYDKDMLKEFDALNKETNLSQAQANKYMEFGIRLAQKQGAELPNMIKQYQQAKVAQFKQAMNTDAELGGGDKTKMNAYLDVADKGYTAFATDDVKAALADTGLNYHPAIIKMFHKLGVIDDLVVSNEGKVQLPFSVKEITIGLPFEFKLETLNIEGENTQGLKKIINNVCVNILNSREEFYIGGSEGQYVETDRSIESVNDSNKLFSINTSATPINSPTTNATIIVMQNNPLPLTILSLSAMFSLEDISDVQ